MPTFSPDIISVYQEDINNNKLQRNQQQYELVQHLQQWLTNNYKLFNLSAVQQIMHKYCIKPRLYTQVNGIYLWGPVGTGKTMLLKKCIDLLPANKVKSLHFLHFMRQVHDVLGVYQHSKDPLCKVAKLFAKQAKLIFIDEFYVEDIADAMILNKLLQSLHKHKVIMFFSSNLHPDNLYANGLQRKEFLPAIELIKDISMVWRLSGDDYRQTVMLNNARYYAPNNNYATNKLSNIFASLTQNKLQDVQFIIKGRIWRVKKRYVDVIWLDFHVCCQQPRSADDYFVLCAQHNIILLENVPQLFAADDEAARRFIAFIDECYISKTQLIISAEVAIVDLYQGELLKFAFARTVSRLTEMQADSYVFSG